MKRRSPSIIRQTIVRIGVGGGLLIAAVTVITYHLIFRAVEERGLIHLEQYVTERVKREEIRLEQVRANLTIATRTFLERYHAPDPPGYLERFDELFMRYPDGAVRNRPEHGDGTKTSTIWVNKATVFTPELKRRTLVIFDVSEKFLPAWFNTFRSLYATSPEQLNIGFDARIPNWVYDTPGDRNQNENETEHINTRAANPERKMVWAGPMPEPTYGDYLVTLSQPVDIDGRHVATWCHDVRLEQMVEDAVHGAVVGMTHMIFRDDGRVIAHPHKKREIIAAEGKYFMRDDPVLARLFAAVGDRRHACFVGFEPQTDLYYAACPLAGTPWLYLTSLPRAELTRQAAGYAQWVLWLGLTAILLLLVFLAFMLQRGVARPLRRLTLATNQLSEGAPGVELDVSTGDELGQLARAFNRMARKIVERDTSLRQLNTDLEHRIDERTAELKSSEERVRAMLEHAPEAIVVLDADTGKFVTGNENALRFFRIDLASLVSLGPAELSPPRQPDGRPSAQAAAEHIAAARDNGTTEFEWMHRPMDGTEAACEVRLSRLPSTNRNILVGTITDISKRKQIEAGLLKALARERELSEMKSGFVSTVSHEFRTPLGIISSSAEILDRYFDRLPPNQRSEHLQTIVRSTRLLSGLMEGVLVLGKVESSAMRFSPHPIDLSTLCSSLADEVMFATQHACPIQVSLGGDLAGAQSDETLLRHIFSNLLSNAVKYSPPQTPVTFSVERADDHAVFVVRDRGIGIPPEDLRTLGTAFHRGRNVGQRPGTGLGLAIVQRCIQLHGGELKLESEVGKGTRACVRLPMFKTALVTVASA